MTNPTNGDLRAALDAVESLLQSEPRLVFSSEDQLNIRRVLESKLPAAHKLAAQDDQPALTLASAPLRKAVRDRLQAARIMVSSTALDTQATDETLRMVASHLNDFFVCRLPSSREVDAAIDARVAPPSPAPIVAAASTRETSGVPLAYQVVPDDTLAIGACKMAIAEDDVLAVAKLYAAAPQADRSPQRFLGLILALAARLPPVLRPAGWLALFDADARHQGAVRRLADDVRAAEFHTWRGEPHGVAAADFVDGCASLLVVWADLAPCFRVLLAHFRRAIDAIGTLRLDSVVDATLSHAAQELGGVPAVERRALLSVLEALACANAVQWQAMLTEAAVARRDQLKAAKLGETEALGAFAARLHSWHMVAHPGSAWGPRDLLSHLAEHQRTVAVALMPTVLEALIARRPGGDDDGRLIALPAPDARIDTLGQALAWWRAERTPTLDAFGHQLGSNMPLLVIILEEALARSRASSVPPSRGRQVGSLARNGTTSPGSRSWSPVAKTPQTVNTPGYKPVHKPAAKLSRSGKGPSVPCCIGCGRTGHEMLDCAEPELDATTKNKILAARKRLDAERVERIGAEAAGRKGKRSVTPGKSGNGSSPHFKQ